MPNLTSTNSPKTKRDLLKALQNVPENTKVEVFEGATLKDIPPRYVLEAKKATVIVLV